ncbi:MAG: aldehyde dehydrogenase [Alistipes sp.]|nr:aldehyde dehydrogenase [Alistipes sp.]
MKTTIDTLCQLADRLTRVPEDVVKCAMAHNPWFTAASIGAAIEAIRTEMLDPEKLAAWLASYAVPVQRPKNVLVIMAGNLPLVGFFDMLCVVVSGHRCLVKPSSKDRVLMEYAIGELRTIDPSLNVEVYDGQFVPDAVIATGSNNTNRYFRAHYGSIPTLLRGSRQSVAVLTGKESEEALRGLEEDIWLHYGLGCRNVSMLFLKRGMPFPPLQPQIRHPKYRNNYLQTKALMQMAGEPFIDLGDAVAVQRAEFPHALSAIAYRYYDTAPEVEQWLAAHDRELQCVVGRSIAHARRVDFGRAQHPALTDYPDAVDVIAFLETI